nr:MULTISPECIES: glycosyltransferase family 2 protein [Acidiphilium]
MQRDEEQCLEPWIRYHGYLFGFENLFIIDHDSRSQKIVEVLKNFEAAGGSVTRLGAEANYQHKGTFVAQEIHRIEKNARYDFVFPIDCDEFLFLRDADGTAICSRNKIFEYLEQFRNFQGRLEIKENLLHILGYPGYFWSQPYQKVFFAGGQCLSLDHGSHVGKARGGDDSIVTRFAYAHFHFKPYEIDRELSRAKLRPWLDVDDPIAVRAFDGPGAHLKDHLLATPEQYYAGFKINEEAILFSEMTSLFNMINIPVNFTEMDANGVEYVGSKNNELTDDITPRNFAQRAVQSMPKLHRMVAITATQSSKSQWSNRRHPSNDALGALDNKADGTFGMHTDIDDKPWWVADFGSTKGISEIRIFNRIDDIGIAARAGRLAIDLAINPDEWLEVYRRETDEPFGGIDGNPLIFKPTIPIPGRFVRIRLLTRNYLHLDQVEVYGEPLPNFPQPAPTLATAEQP